MRGANGHKLLLAPHHAALIVDKDTERPEAIEKYFCNMFREIGETLQEYATRHEVHHAATTKHAVELAGINKGYMYVRRAGSTASDKTLVLAQTAADLSYDNVKKVMYRTVGMNTPLPRERDYKKERNYMAESWGPEALGAEYDQGQGEEKEDESYYQEEAQFQHSFLEEEEPIVAEESY